MQLPAPARTSDRHFKLSVVQDQSHASPSQIQLSSRTAGSHLPTVQAGSVGVNCVTSHPSILLRNLSASPVDSSIPNLSHIPLLLSRVQVTIILDLLRGHEPGFTPIWELARGYEFSGDRLSPSAQ